MILAYSSDLSPLAAIMAGQHNKKTGCGSLEEEWTRSRHQPTRKRVFA
jgi:hypothetical protein